MHLRLDGNAQVSWYTEFKWKEMEKFFYFLEWKQMLNNSHRDISTIKQNQIVKEQNVDMNQFCRTHFSALHPLIPHLYSTLLPSQQKFNQHYLYHLSPITKLTLLLFNNQQTAISPQFLRWSSHWDWLVPLPFLFCQ